MVSDITFYQISVITIACLWFLYFIFSLLYVRLKKYRLSFFMFLVTLTISGRVILVNPVTIINDNNNIEQKLLLIPHKYHLSNGSRVILKPVPGLKQKWLINDGSKNAWLETFIYGKHDTTLRKNKIIPPYSVVDIFDIDYYFDIPPERLTAIKPTVVKGWLHR